MKVRPLLTLAAMSVVATLGLTACGGPDSGGGNGSTDSGAPKTLTIGAAIAPTTFSPQEAADAHNVQWFQPVYDNLVRQLPDGEFEPMIAEEWEYNDDNTVLTMKLNDGVTFASGGELDAATVEANLEATRDGSGPLASQFVSIKDVVVVDPLTVEIQLHAPDPALMRSLSQPGGTMTKIEKIGDESLATEPDGTGPYVLDASRTVSGSEYVFTKREDYWNTDLELPFDTIVVKPMTDITARINALASGQVDAAPIDTKSQATVEGSGAEVLTYPGAGVMGLFLLDRAGEIAPALADVRVRQAINMALDRANMLATLRSGYGAATQQVFNPQSDAYDAALDETYPFDKDKALKLMADAGYADGFTVKSPDVSSFFPEATIAAQALADIGVNIEWVSVAQTETLSEMLSGKYPLVLMQLQSTEPWQTVQFFIAPDAAWNARDSQDPELDKLIEKAQYADPGQAQAAAFQELNEWLVDQAWFAPFYFADNIFAISSDVTVEPQVYQGVPSIYNYAPAS